MNKVLPDLWSARVGRLAYQTNTQFYLFRLGDTLIDTGPPNQWARVRAFIDASSGPSAAGRPIRRVLVTHHHEDHAGLGGAIQAAYKVPVAVPALSVPWLTVPMVQEYYRRIIWGTFQPFQPAATLAASEALPELGADVRLDVVHAPGHIEDHHCFHLPSRGWLFTADLFVARRRLYYRKDEDASIELASIRRVLALDFDTLLCAHRGVIRDGKRALADRVAFMDEVRARTLEMRGQGLPPHVVRARLLGREGAMRYFTLNDFSKQRFIDTLR